MAQLLAFSLMIRYDARHGACHNATNKVHCMRNTKIYISATFESSFTYYSPSAAFKTGINILTRLMTKDHN
jgi:hypothetical protein